MKFTWCKLQLPGLQEEFKDFLINTGVVDILKCSKNQWKTFIGRKISEKNELEILTMVSGHLMITKLSEAKYTLT